MPTVSYRHACNQGSFTNEHFQYIDKKAGKWTKEQQKVSIIRQNPPLGLIGALQQKKALAR